MATEVVKDLSKQDVTLRTKALHGAKYLLDYPSTRIEIQIFSRTRTRFTAIGNKMDSLYPGISTSKEVYCTLRILISPFCL
jgi:hypothetical protein